MKTTLLLAAFTCLTFGINAQVGPTASCQNATVYLDGTGNATIAGSDIDGGSTDDAMTGSLTLTPSQTTFSCADLGGTVGPGMIISGAYDGPLTGGVPKGIELFVTGDIADLSVFGIGSANNGGGSDGEEFTFPADSYVAGDFIYVTTDSAGFADFFGFNADYLSGSMSINGDDAVELFQNGVVTDVFGDINTDGSGQPWDYLDGWAYRNDFQTANGGVFNDANWSFSGINVFDGQTSNVTAPTPFLTGTFTPATTGAVAVTLVVEDGNADQDSCVAFVTVLDTLAPVGPAIIPVIMEECAIDTLVDPIVTDNCSSNIIITNDAVFPITVQGTTVVTWTYVDESGNSTTQIQDVIVNDATAPVPDLDTLATVESCEEVTSLSAPTASDSCSGTITATSDAVFPITSNTTVTWTYDDGHGNTETQTQDVTITVVDVTISVSGNTLTANASGVSYQWINCIDNGAIGGETGQTYTPTTAGDYAVIITDGSCTDTSACEFVDPTSSLEESSINIGLTIYPNPSNGNVAIETNDNISGTIMIMDATGSLIVTNQIEGSKTTVNIEAIANGVYQVVLTTDKGIYRRRLIKE